MKRLTLTAPDDVIVSVVQLVLDKVKDLHIDHIEDDPPLPSPPDRNEPPEARPRKVGGSAGRVTDTRNAPRGYKHPHDGNPGHPKRTKTYDGKTTDEVVLDMLKQHPDGLEGRAISKSLRDAGFAKNTGWGVLARLADERKIVRIGDLWHLNK